jgi:hypothetical protein
MHGVQLSRIRYAGMTSEHPACVSMREVYNVRMRFEYLACISMHQGTHAFCVSHLCNHAAGAVRPGCGLTGPAAELVSYKAEIQKESPNCGLYPSSSAWIAAHTLQLCYCSD